MMFLTACPPPCRHVYALKFSYVYFKVGTNISPVLPLIHCTVVQEVPLGMDVLDDHELDDDIPGIMVAIGGDGNLVNMVHNGHDDREH